MKQPARLLALNHERAKAEQAAVHTAEGVKERPKKHRSTKKAQALSEGLFDDEGARGA